MKTNVTLIGMPGSGKSTVGIILAKLLSYGFMDTDILIQEHYRKSLQRILEETGYLNLRQIEAERILRINANRQVIATGGSAVYSDAAMARLKQVSVMVFLKAGYETLTRRIHNFESRGIAKSAEQTFRSLFYERQPLYEQHAEITVDVDHLTQDGIAQNIARRITPRAASPAIV